MDISTVENNLLSGKYESGYQFALDMRLIWSNSFFYNASNSDLYSATMELSSCFERLMKGNEDVTLGEQKNLVQDLYRKIDILSKGIKGIQNKPIIVTPPQPVIKPPIKLPMDKPLGFMEKKQLCQNIKKLEPKYLKGVLDIVKECMDIKGEELEFDIEKLPPKVCRELDKYVKNCLQLINRSQKSKKTANIDGIKSSQEVTFAKINEINTQIEKLKDPPKNEVYLPEEESESESSSTSESEEEDEVPMMQRDENHQEFNSSLVDFDKLY